MRYRGNAKHNFGSSLMCSPESVALYEYGDMAMQKGSEIDEQRKAESQEKLTRMKQIEILGLLGTISFEQDYDYKKARLLDQLG